MDTTWEKTLKVFGAIGLIITTIVGIFAIGNYVKDYFWPSESRLEVIGQYDICALPSNLADSSLNIRGDISHQQIYVSNTGRQTAKGVRLHTAISGAYAINNDDSKAFDKQITLPDLQPTETINLSIWSNNSVSAYIKGTTKITYDNGASNISYYDKVSGFWVSVARVFEMFWFVFLIIILFILIIPILYFLEKKGYISDKDNKKV